MVGHMKTTTFGTKEEDGDDNNTNITCNQTRKVKTPREGAFCVTFFFGFCFVAGHFFPFYVYVKPIKFFVTKNLVIIYKLSTIEGFYHKVNDFSTILVLNFFCHSPKEIGKKSKNML